VIFNLLAGIVASSTLLLRLHKYESDHETNVDKFSTTDPHCCESVSGHGIERL